MVSVTGEQLGMGFQYALDPIFVRFGVPIRVAAYVTRKDLVMSGNDKR